MELSYNIKLYNVEGISRSDTPYFSDSDSQDDYFESKLVRQITASFFPPFFTDEITFDDTDLNIFTKVNYLSVKFSDKVFYYFIDGINYNNSGSLSLKVAMDTIQTFMFDFNVKNGVIERKFIDRWNSDGSINRSYLRENVSRNNFVVNSFDYLFSDDYEFMIVVKLTAFADGNKHANVSDSIELYSPSGTGYSATDISITTPYTYLYCPMHGRNGNIVKDNSSYPDLFTPSTLISAAGRSVQCVDIYAIPFNCIRGLTLDKSNISDLKWNQDYTIFDEYKPVFSFENIGGLLPTDTEFGDIYCLFAHNVVKIQPQAKNLSFSFYKNLSKDIQFNPNYCPVLLDENYIKEEFGELSSLTTYPLYQLINPSLYQIYYADLTSGYRYYTLSNKPDFDNDKFSNKIIVSKPLYFDLKNNAWSNYIASNRATLMTGIINDGVNLGNQYANASLDNASLDRKKDAILSNSGSYDKRYKSPTLKQKYYGQVQELQYEKQENSLESFKGAGSNVANYVTNEINLKYTPDTVKQLGNFICDRFSNSCRVVNRISYVDDFSQCAQYYHRNGYLVNEYFNPLTSTSDSYTSSYYTVTALGEKTIIFSFNTSDNHLYNGNGSVDLFLLGCNGTLVSSTISVDSTRTVITVTAVVDITSIGSIPYKQFQFLVTYDAIHSIGIIDYVHTRHYFNVLKMKTCDIYLNMLQSNDIISDISSRLIDGIRLWDVSFGELCDFRFDNVERSYLS